MHAGKPSTTAHRVALRRAAHQVFDDPVVFRDPLALRILGLTPHSIASGELRAPARPYSVGMRAFLVARSIFAETALAAAVKRGVSQYVLLGAGLDTFAYRNVSVDLRVFEVDHPDTQAWKLQLLQDAVIDVPPTATHVPVDFQCDSLSERLHAGGFNPRQPAVFAWLGVVPYLTDAAFAATLAYLASCAKDSALVMDYGLPRNALPPNEQLAFDSLASRVAAAGEPLQLFFEPAGIHARLAARGWMVVEDLDRNGMNTRYFAGRGDALRCYGSGPHLLQAVLV